jgi:uncharacterized Zn finger protein
VMHLDVQPGHIHAKVAGSSLYDVAIGIQPLAADLWTKLCKACAGQIGSLIELLSGKFSDHVMSVMINRESGLFPSPKEIKLSCSCPDSATMCKHVAAVLYGVGSRLDSQPELLFLLRSVDPGQLVADAMETDLASAPSDATTLDATTLSDVFGIALEPAPPPPPAPKPAARKPARKAAAKKPAAKKAVAKKAVAKKSTAKRGVAKKAIASKPTPKTAGPRRAAKSSALKPKKRQRPG